MWEIKSKKKKKHVEIEPLKSSAIAAAEQLTNCLFVNQDNATDAGIEAMKQELPNHDSNHELGSATGTENNGIETQMLNTWDLHEEIK